MAKTPQGPQTLAFPLPHLGEVTVGARSEYQQRASVDLYNVRLQDLGDRRRVASRPGTITLMGQTNQLASSGTIRQVLCLQPATFQDSSSNRATWLLAVAGGHLYQITVGTVPVISDRGSFFFGGRRTTSAVFGAYAYFTDGSAYKRLKLDDGTVTTWTASPGTIFPTCRLVCEYRGRMFLARPTNNPHQWACSRQGDPLDWDYSADDVGAAVAGTSGFRGQINTPIECIIPNRGASLIFGGQYTIHELVGDPTLGEIKVRSTNIGILTSDSWCWGPGGDLYFVGTGGLYRMGPVGEPEPINLDKLTNLLRRLPNIGYWINLAYDPDNFEIHIHITPPTKVASTHLVYSVRTGGFVEKAYPDDHGPITSCVFDDGNGLRKIVLGGREGMVMFESDTVAYDANSSGTATANVGFTSRALLGPLRPLPEPGRGKMLGLQLVAGEAPAGFSDSDFACAWTVQVGKSPYLAQTSPERSVTGTLAGFGRAVPDYQRLSGGWYFLKLTNATGGKLWSLDQAWGRFLPAGIERA